MREILVAWKPGSRYLNLRRVCWLIRPTRAATPPFQTTFAEQVERIEALARSLDAAAAKAEAIAAALSAEVFG